MNDFTKLFAGDEGVVFLAMTEDPEIDVEKFIKKNPSEYLNAAGAREAYLKWREGRRGVEKKELFFYYEAAGRLGTA